MSISAAHLNQAAPTSLRRSNIRNVLQRSSWLTMLPVVLNETHKGLLIKFSYKFGMLSDALMFAVLFIGITFFMGKGTIEPEQLASALLGYGVWFYLVTAIGDASYTLHDEAQAGTLEQMYMSPAPTGLILLGRTSATLATATVTLLLVTIPMSYFLGINIPLRWAGLPVFILTWMGIYGFGFMVAAATLLYKQVGAFANLIQNVIVFLNGAFVPVENFPNWLYTIAHTLPSTQGIIVLRKVLLDGQTLGMVWQDGSLVWLLVHSGLYFVAGWFLFSLSERVAKRKGLLGQY